MPIHRLFDTSIRRRQISLDGVWDLKPDPDDRGLSEAWHLGFPPDALPTWVPGVWNTRHALRNYEGVVWYRRSVTLRSCAAAILNFAAVTHQANVWLDGEPLGEHYGGFLPFSFVLLRPEAGEHELVVRVDNTHDMTTTIPSSVLDWFCYGGIFRPVWVEELEQAGYVSSLRLTPAVVGGVPTLRLRAELINLCEETISDQWRLYVDGTLLRSDQCRIRPHDSEVLLFAVDLPAAALWTPAAPHLHTVRLEFAGDDLIERTGFRELVIEGREVLLNGEPLRIRGVNRHEDHPDWGLALPQHLMMRDLDLAQDLNLNALRGAHYPNDQRMLDLCDERGLLFMEEIPLWGFCQEQLRLDIIGDRAGAMLWATIERDIAHPCIWAWSLLSECATDTPEGQLVLEHLVETAREIDPTRPLTFASDRGLDDLCFDLVDVVCLNAHYGWYRHDLTWEQFLDQMRTTIGDKPLIISEFGAGGLYGCHALEEGVIWSEEHQRKVLLDGLETFLRRPDLAGFYIWQLCDTRIDGGEHALCRPRNCNNKGLLTEHRQPKLAYEAVRGRLSVDWAAGASSQVRALYGAWSGEQGAPSSDGIGASPGG
jgi:beta-glucuronidase